MNSCDPCATRARICFCVDDFGLDEGVNDAVLALAARGRVQATSCMVFAPAWASGAMALRRQDGVSLDIGLHLDFTQYPSRPALRQPLRALILRSVAGLLDASVIRSEIRAQFDAFEHAMGRRPDHVDGHQHVHQLPCIRDELISEMQRRYGACAPWIRISRGLPWRLEGSLAGWRTAAKSGVITALGAARLDRLAGAAHLGRNHRLLGVHGFSPSANAYRQLLGAWLSAAEDGDLLMCHPSARGIAGDAIAGARLAEFEVLGDAALDADITTRGVVPMAMSRILRNTH